MKNIPFIFHLYPTYCLFIPFFIWWFWTETNPHGSSEGDTAEVPHSLGWSVGTCVAWWVRLPPERFQAGGGTSGPRKDQSINGGIEIGGCSTRKKTGKNNMGTITETLGFHMIVYDCQITRCCLLVSPSYVDWFMFTHLTIASSSPKFS